MCGSRVKYLQRKKQPAGPLYHQWAVGGLCFLLWGTIMKVTQSFHVYHWTLSLKGPVLVSLPQFGKQSHTEAVFSENNFSFEIMGLEILFSGLHTKSLRSWLWIPRSQGRPDVAASTYNNSSFKKVGGRGRRIPGSQRAIQLRVCSNKQSWLKVEGEDQHPSCLLTSTHALEHVCPRLHKHTHYTYMHPIRAHTKTIK